MNLQENIHRIKEVMGILSEVKTTYKKPIQGDAENLTRFGKSVWPSKNNPDIVYKFTTNEKDLLELKEEKYLSDTYPDLFCKTYGEIKKIKKSKYTPENSNGDEYFYYLAYERLDTKRFYNFWMTIEGIFETSNKIDVYDNDYNIDWDVWGLESFTLGDYEVSKEVFHIMESEVKERAPELYNEYIMFINLIFDIREVREHPDTNSGNFGYDKNGKIKSLDI